MNRPTTYVAGLLSLASSSTAAATVSSTSNAAIAATTSTSTAVAIATGLRAGSSNVTDLAAWLMLMKIQAVHATHFTHTCSTLDRHLRRRRRHHCSHRRCCHPSCRLHQIADRRPDRSHGLDGLRRRTCSKFLALEHPGILG